MDTKIISAIKEMQSLESNNDNNGAFHLANSFLSTFPDSSEILYYYLRYAQLIDEDSEYYSELSLETIGEGYMRLIELSNGNNLEYLIDALGFFHNVLDDKSERIIVLFNQTYEKLKYLNRDFLAMYFSFHLELNNSDAVNYSKNELRNLVDTIPRDKSDSSDYY